MVKNIAIVSPASGADRDIIEGAAKILTSRYGVQVVVNDYVNNPGTAEHRAAQFLDYVLDDEIDMILASRGGEGSADILPYLGEAATKIIQAKPKIICGMSDITALLFYFHQMYRWPVIHGFCGVTFGREMQAGSLESLDAIFKGEPVEIADLKPLNDSADNAHIVGEVVAGNLTLLNISIGDTWEFDASDKILVVEDWCEKGYSVDRTLKYFERIGKFKDIKAFIFGDFFSGKISADQSEDKMHRKYLEKTLTRFAHRNDFPVLMTDWVGHGDKLKNILFSPAEIKNNTLFISTQQALPSFEKSMKVSRPS